MLLHITPIERVALRWLAEGKDSSEMARAFGMSEAEVSAQITALLVRMGAKTYREAVAEASARGLLD